MAAPAFGSVGSYTTGSAASVAVDVPDSVAADEIIVVFVYKENTATVTGLDTGFAEATDSPNSTAGPQNVRFHIFWKRATAADSTAGTYTFSWTGSTYRAAIAVRYSGAITTGDPWDDTAVSNTTTDATGAPALQLTTTDADRLIVYASSSYNSGAWTPPTGFTERVDQGDMTVTDLAQAASGTSASLQATQSSSTHIAWAGALKPPAAGGTTASAGHAAGTGAANAATAAITATAGNAAGTGAANAATTAVVTAAGNAAGTGAANAPAVAIAVPAGHAAGAGAANAPAVAVTATAGSAAGTGAANGTTTNVTPAAEHASGAGTANNAVAAITATAGHASGTGTAHQPTVQTGAAATASAEHASGTGAAYGPTVAITAGAGHAAGTGAALQPSIPHEGDIDVTAGHAEGAGQAYRPTVVVVNAPHGGNWRDLQAILSDSRQLARAYATQSPVACECGEPLRTGPRGVLYCAFDGRRY